MKTIIKNIAKRVYHSIPYTWRVPGVYYKTLEQITNCNSKEDVAAFQLSKLKCIVAHAYKNVPGYYQLYKEAGITPDEIQCIADLKKIPIIEKETIRANIDDFTARNVDRSALHLSRTSGTSGTPFAFYQTKEEEWVEQAFVGRAWALGGWNMHQSGIMLRGAYAGDENHIFKKCDNNNFYIHNKGYFVSPNFLTDKHYPVYRDFLKEHSELSYIFALPSSITLLSQLIISHHDEGVSNVKSIYLGSESIYDWQHDFIREAFPDVTVISLYAQTERSIMAYWCKDSKKYHVDPHYGYTELLMGGQEVEVGEIGEMVGTSFWNTTTPFIRYRTKDFAKKGSNGCKSCGLTYKLLDSIDGRLQDVLIGREGRYVPYNAFDGSLLHGSVFKEIVKFKIIQDEPGKLVFEIQVREGFSPEKKKEFDSIITNYLGDDFTVDIRVVDVITPGKNGKSNIVEQHLPVDIARRS